jgi:pimeloyl-ACP methyl ester carboxylesterase
MEPYYHLTFGEKPLVTLLHGLGEDHSIFNHQTNYLQSLGHSTLVLDLRGHGRTPLDRKVSVQSHVKDLEDVLQKEQIPQTNLVGFSLGGTVALEYTHQHPEKVNQLCLINPGLYRRDFLGWQVHAVSPLIALLGLGAFVDKKTRNKFADLSKAPHSTAYYSLPNGLRNTPLAGLYANIFAFMRYGIPDYLPEIETPALIIKSKSDELMTSKSAEFLQQQLPHSQLVKIKGNHTVMLSNPQELARQIAQFFRE